jgi:hypothetical protein
MWHGLPVLPGALDMCVRLLCTGRPEGESKMIRSILPYFFFALPSACSSNPRPFEHAGPVVCLSSPFSGHLFASRLQASKLSTHGGTGPDCLLASQAHMGACQQLSAREASPLIPPAESRAALPAPPSPPAAIRVSWIPPATTPRLVSQQHWSGARGGDCASIGPDGSGEAQVDRSQVRTREGGSNASSNFQSIDVR